MKFSTYGKCEKNRLKFPNNKVFTSIFHYFYVQISIHSYNRFFGNDPKADITVAFVPVIVVVKFKDC